MAVKREKIFVDSINEGICTLLVGKKAFSVDLPARILPRGTSEGIRRGLAHYDPAKVRKAQKILP